MAYHCSYNKERQTIMDANSLLGNKFKAQLSKFTGIISKCCSLPQKKLIHQILYGIQASKDVKISNISRSLNESIPLIKTEDRLCNGLAKWELHNKISDALLKLASRHVTSTMVIGIDPGDIRKPYAKEMEYLCSIYDGDKKESCVGYHLCEVVASNLDHDKIVPLYLEAYSTDAPTDNHGTEMIKKCINKVVEHTGTIGVWAIDRQGDNEEIINHFEDNQLKFITRARSNRFLHFGHNTTRQCAAQRLCDHVKTKYNMTVTRLENGAETQVPIKISTITVALPKQPDRWFNAVIVEGFGNIPMVLITNQQVDIQNPASIRRILNQYLTRWKCDECFRYIKQSYNLEDVRVRSYTAIKNMIVLVFAVAYFTSIYLGHALKLQLYVEKVFILAKHFFAIPKFYHYAMADGIYNILKIIKKPFDEYKRNKPPESDPWQLEIIF